MFHLLSLKKRIFLNKISYKTQVSFADKGDCSNLVGAIIGEMTVLISVFYN